MVKKRNATHIEAETLVPVCLPCVLAIRPDLAEDPSLKLVLLGDGPARTMTEDERKLIVQLHGGKSNV
jgi:hypothetical protein